MLGRNVSARCAPFVRSLASKKKAEGALSDNEAKVRQRKKDHIDICLKKEIEPEPCSFDSYRLPYKTLPEIDLADVCTKTKLFHWDIAFPFIVSSMTGGEMHGRTINMNVAKACNAEGIPFGLGSMRVLKRYPEEVKTFAVKEFAPDVPMFANVGLVQMNYGFTADDVNKLVESVNADGLFIHLNAIQEAVQPEGDTNFKDLIPKLEKLLKKVKVPVIVKEVGHGMDGATARRLRDIGVEYIDVAGLGGSSWSWIEGYRQPGYAQDQSSNLGYIMRDIGIPTSVSLSQCRDINGLKLVAGGGIRTGVHIAKALAMGAHYATAAKPFLAAALESAESVQKILKRLRKELEVAMFTAGITNLSELRVASLFQRDQHPSFRA